MNGHRADAVGICGSVLFIAAFVYANRAQVLNKRLFNALNLLGAILLLVSLSVHFNLAAVLLETAWAAIALAGLISALREPSLPSEWRPRQACHGIANARVFRGFRAFAVNQY